MAYQEVAALALAIDALGGELVGGERGLAEHVAGPALHLHEGAHGALLVEVGLGQHARG